MPNHNNRRTSYMVWRKLGMWQAQCGSLGCSRRGFPAGLHWKSCAQAAPLSAQVAPVAIFAKGITVCTGVPLSAHGHQYICTGHHSLHRDTTIYTGAPLSAHRHRYVLTIHTGGTTVSEDSKLERHLQKSRRATEMLSRLLLFGNAPEVDMKRCARF